MAYHTSSNGLDHVPEHLSMSNVMEPEMVMPNSDEETPGSPSTPGSNRHYATGGAGPLKRAVSSPNVRGLGGDGTTLSAADKKRNKLGYHRTAVACGHCRRRKIRCIPALDDTSGRCSNCIRLKKDCQFFPVDQQSVTASRRGRSDSKAESALAEGDISASSSEPGVPVLGSSKEDLFGQPNRKGQAPVSPEELRFHSLGYGHSHDHDPVGSQYEHTGLTSPPYSQPPFYATSEAHILPGSYSSTYGAPVFSPSMTTSPHPVIYSQHRSDMGEFGWSGQSSDRSVSVADSDDTFTSYAAQRANSFPTIARRHPYSGADHGFPVSAEYQQQMMARHYNDPSQYSGAGWMAPPNTRAPHTPASTAAGFPQWGYPTPLSFVREEEDQSHTAMHGHGHQAFHRG